MVDVSDMEFGKSPGFIEGDDHNLHQSSYSQMKLWDVHLNTPKNVSPFSEGDYY